MHVEHCFSNYSAGLRYTASKDQWERFEKVKVERPFRSEKMSFTLMPPKIQEDERELWIHGVECSDEAKK